MRHSCFRGFPLLFDFCIKVKPAGSNIGKYSLDFYTIEVFNLNYSSFILAILFYNMERHIKPRGRNIEFIITGFIAQQLINPFAK